MEEREREIKAGERELGPARAELKAEPKRWHFSLPRLFLGPAPRGGCGWGGGCRTGDGTTEINSLPSTKQNHLIIIPKEAVEDGNHRTCDEDIHLGHCIIIHTYTHTLGI